MYISSTSDTTPSAATSTPTSDTSADAAVNAANQVSASQQGFASNMSSFLTLLTTQLQNQDPLSPMDSTQFTNQLVEFSQVQQQIDINSNLTSLISLSQQSIASNAVNYIGKTIEGPSSAAPLQNGELNASYDLSAASTSTTIAVSDSAGNVVYTTTGETAAGVHAFNWNGQDANGNQLPDGSYSLQVTAIGANGSNVTASTTAFGTVTGVTAENGVQTLIIGENIGIPVSEVLGVTTPATTTDTSN